MNDFVESAMSDEEKKPKPEQVVTKSDEESPAGEEVSLVEQVETISAVEQELLETKNKLLRLAADFENYKKISAREQHNAVKFANENLLLNLLPIMDNLEQAVVACKKSGQNNDVLVGVEMVLKQLSDSLQKYGLESFSALGKPFDPALHEAMGEQESDSLEAGTVLVEYQKGYMLHTRLLRPARVVIAKKPK